MPVCLIRHRYVAFFLSFLSHFAPLLPPFPFSSLSLSLSFSLCLSVSLFPFPFSLGAIGVPFPVSRARNTLDLLATQIKIEQPVIKHKWGYWPEPLSPVIDFHFGAAPRLARRACILDTTSVSFLFFFFFFFPSRPIRFGRFDHASRSGSCWRCIDHGRTFSFVIERERERERERGGAGSVCDPSAIKFARKRRRRAVSRFLSRIREGETLVAFADDRYLGRNPIRSNPRESVKCRGAAGRTTRQVFLYEVHVRAASLAHGQRNYRVVNRNNRDYLRYATSISVKRRIILPEG